jgi:agmatine deiminase
MSIKARLNFPFLSLVFVFFLFPAWGESTPPSAPPVGPVRQPAEFERATGVFIRYPLSIPPHFVKEMAREITVYCLVSPARQTQAEADFNKEGVNLANVTFIPAENEYGFTRDFTPWMIFDGEGKPGLVDLQYYPDRPKDNAISYTLGKFLNLPVYALDLYYEGGNYMTDGMGVSSSSTQVYKANSKYSSRQIADKMQEYLGVKTFHVLDDPTPYEIQHIDTWAKFLAPDKIMISRVANSNPNYAKVEAVVAYFRKQKSSFGRPYRIYRMDAGENDPYINALILNDRVFMPIRGTSLDANSKPSAKDSVAIKTYQSAMPGYRVYGILSKDPSVIWYGGDALHCRAYGLNDPGALHISHIPPPDTVTSGRDGIPLTAALTPLGGKALIPESLFVFYKKPGDAQFGKVRLSDAGGGKYQAMIPVPASSTEIAYYIHAADGSNRSENHPFIGSADPHRFYAMVSPILMVSSQGSRPSIHLAGGIRMDDLEGMERAVVFDVKGQALREVSGRHAQDLAARLPRVFSHLQKGIYTLRLTGAKKTLHRKILLGS